MGGGPLNASGPDATDASTDASGTSEASTTESSTRPRRANSTVTCNISDTIVVTPHAGSSCACEAVGC